MITQNKVALVTGASRGIGAAIARRLSEEGFSVAINYASNITEAEKLVSEIKEAGGQAIAIQADVSDSAAAARLFEETVTAFGGIDVFVNSAGIMKLAPLADSDDTLFDSQVAVNLKGAFNTLRLASRYLREGGRIISLSTSVIGLKLENYSVYAATKSAVETLTVILSKELRGRSITANVVAPGPTATDLFLHGKSPELIERMSKMNPLERLGTPDDIAYTVLFLASPQGGWINGQVLRANGGMI
ncbi:SDR family oxidoreductase (plasmid) [Cedecea neteri]|uniref:SDR family oxidoreductase n=1 Tax=Cedecea neteri TaxID=158822 RepID=UPI002892E21F|nr:SDR family oxidoreductase [Cedecea neteri]WNJ82202.1 SDR family oxidoreductase [Cedecea neteri]